MSALRKPAGTPARFDPTAQHRRAMLAKVHIAKATLRMTDDDYVAVLLRVTTRTSAKDCTQAELDKLVREFERLGFSAKAKAKARASRAADHPSARKARAMWISLGHLGAIADTSERALEAFARRQLHCDRLQWANQALTYRLIEALKAIADRHGWDTSSAGVRPLALPTVLKRRLCEAILGKLWQAEIAPLHWDINRAAREFAGVEVDLLFASADTLDLVAGALGRVLAGSRS